MMLYGSSRLPLAVTTRTLLLLVLLIHASLPNRRVVVSAANNRPSSSLSSSHFVRKPISTRPGISKIFQRRLERATELAKQEQDVEDMNAELIAKADSLVESYGHRRLIVLPLDKRFDPPISKFEHGHVQTANKVSVPDTFLKAIGLSGADPPWLLRIKRVEGVTTEPRVDVPTMYAAEPLDEVVGSPMDFRSPPNYIFVPLWMMRSLGLRPRDVVDVSLVAKTQDIPPASLVKLRAHSKEWEKISNYGNVLEMELRHYMCMTKGTTIPFDYNNKRYWFDIVEVRSSPKGAKEKTVRTMDCDLATDFVRPRKDNVQIDDRKDNDDDDEDRNDIKSRFR